MGGPIGRGGDWRIDRASRATYQGGADAPWSPVERRLSFFPTAGRLDSAPTGRPIDLCPATQKPVDPPITIGITVLRADADSQTHPPQYGGGDVRD
jgi:hypothetical protein